MPTTIATLGRERTVATLARRLYQLEGRGNAELQRSAEAALIAANPRLSSAEGFRNGAQIVVPAVTGLQVSDAVTTPQADDSGLSNEATLRLQALGSRIEDSFSRAAAQRKKLAEKLADPGFAKQARAALAESLDHIDRARERLEKEEEQAAEQSQQLQAAVNSAIENIKLLDELARRSAPRR